MKKQLLFIIFCFCILHFAFAQQYEWQLIDLSLISGTPDFSDIHAVDEDFAFISCSNQANISEQMMALALSLRRLQALELLLKLFI